MKSSGLISTLGAWKLSMNATRNFVPLLSNAPVNKQYQSIKIKFKRKFIIITLFINNFSLCTKQAFSYNEPGEVIAHQAIYKTSFLKKGKIRQETALLYIQVYIEYGCPWSTMFTVNYRTQLCCEKKLRPVHNKPLTRY